MGEAKRRRQGALIQGGSEAEQPQVVDTLGGRMHVRWDSGAAATPHGQLVYFAEFLATTGVFERWVSACPLEYRSGNAPDKRDVLGTLMLGMLAASARSSPSLRGFDPPRRPAVLLVLRVVLGGYGKGLLLYVCINALSVPAVDLLSLALGEAQDR